MKIHSYYHIHIYIYSDMFNDAFLVIFPRLHKLQFLVTFLKERVHIDHCQSVPVYDRTGIFGNSGGIIITGYHFYSYCFFLTQQNVKLKNVF